jgi:ribosomal protein L3
MNERIKNTIKEKLTRSQVYKRAKKGSYPVTLVAVENSKVISQETIKTPQHVLAVYSVMAKKYPKSSIHLEDSTGQILEKLKEKLTNKSSVDKHIEDFKGSDAPQFKGKSNSKKVQMAVAAYLSKHKK